MSAPPRQDSWTAAQEQLLRDFPGTSIPQLRVMLAEIGPPRTESAVDSKIKLMRIQSRRPLASTQSIYAGNWPCVPPPEEADKLFVARVVKAAQAEGLLTIVRAA